MLDIFKHICCEILGNHNFMQDFSETQFWDEVEFPCFLHNESFLSAMSIWPVSALISAMCDLCLELSIENVILNELAIQ